MKYLPWLVVVVLIIILVWCFLPKTQTVSMRLDADGRIDTSYHQDAVLFHKERLRWSCENCPDGVEFGVAEIFHLADLDLAAHSLARLGPAGEEGIVDLSSADLAHASHAPFGDWEPPPPGTEPILSPPYQVAEGSHLFKFSWVIHRDGAEVDRWDPHFAGHEKRR